MPHGACQIMAETEPACRASVRLVGPKTLRVVVEQLGFLDVVRVELVARRADRAVRLRQRVVGRELEPAGHAAPEAEDERRVLALRPG